MCSAQQFDKWVLEKTFVETRLRKEKLLTSSQQKRKLTAKDAKSRKSYRERAQVRMTKNPRSPALKRLRYGGPPLKTSNET